MDSDEVLIGRRLRALRGKRSLAATAELAGISQSYLSRLERGERQINSRHLLEALADALRVAPSELMAFPFPSRDPVTAEAQAAISGVETALSEYRLGEPSDVEPRPWPVIAAELRRLNQELRPACDYAAQGLVLPRLLAELHAVHEAGGEHRTDALLGLMDCYHTATVLTKNLGAQGLPQLAALHAQMVADALGSPEWAGLAAWLRAHALGGSDRPRQVTISMRAANSLQSELGSPEVAQVYGMLHLSCALAAAAKRQADDAEAHLREAEEIASRLPEVGTFGSLYFGRANIAIWRVSIGTELGWGPKVAEAAEAARPDAVPSAARQAMYWADLGRALVESPKTRERGVLALRRAEDIAPQRIRTNALVRASVTELANRAKRDALGRELRGMVHRMGVRLG
ncbi:helix-turn-helix domain-containing protein [Streptoalloteichus hindustanus]|uniref:Transcriptional regulator, contains XRE-family HTH domain n=1 Tax=Streptoalloteichus hindustanus TaxID=2017 RepID=A0A1M4Y6V0_STRHI|nr:helix-turn-helix transcriptional regulator [Streptoalloteichus hindustanus]SHF01346.1 Transcriptional regulator, contains XRE-family HTH domain [Streptoalloteichus hindustanus]